MGSKTVHVDDQELIRVENISLNVLTDIQLQTQLIEHIDPVYRIQVRAKPLFNQLNIDNKNQVRWSSLPPSIEFNPPLYPSLVS